MDYFYGGNGEIKNQSKQTDPERSAGIRFHHHEYARIARARKHTNTPHTHKHIHSIQSQKLRVAAVIAQSYSDRLS